jgi:hypothetical protein
MDIDLRGLGCEIGRIMIGFSGAGQALSGLGLTIYGLHVREGSRIRAQTRAESGPSAPWSDKWMDPDSDDWSPLDSPGVGVSGRF